MSSPGRYRHSSKFRSSGASMLLRLVLLLAAWQGPIPWCHSHAAQATDDSGSWLAEHLSSHHKSSAQDGASQGIPAARASEGLGWHFHADFPARPTGDQDPGSEPLPAEFPANPLVNQRVADWQSGDRPMPLSQLLMPAVSCLAFSSATERALLRSPGNFFDGYAAALPLPLRFCILRC